ncbi:MAG: right-handed parallel beta-helix repeat-containing protein [Planctomycetota bacterium]|nr:right-handed parallel beta-helix repeat-containing protein [Planctomycetota bacterium]
MIWANITALSLLASAVLGTEYEVPGDFPSIQDAVNAASTGDTINVGPGTWPGRLDYRGKDLLIRSTAGIEDTILDANGVGTVVIFTSGEGPGAILEGFTITNGSGQLHQGEMTGGGIQIVESSPTIRDCLITNNTAHNGGGIAIWESSPVIEHCTFTYNHADGDGGGLRLHHFTTLILQDCTFTENSAQVFGGAIAYGNDSDGEHIDCQFDSNTAGLRGGAIASACDCNDPQLWGSNFCNSVPDHILGGWQDFGGNEFCPVCAMDVSADGTVDVNDVLQVINAWGNCICVEDVDGDTVVGVNDLLAILSEYGPCPE